MLNVAINTLLNNTTHFISFSYHVDISLCTLPRIRIGYAYLARYTIGIPCQVYCCPNPEWMVHWVQLLRLLSAICIMRMLINFRYIVQPYSGRPAKYQTMCDRKETQQQFDARVAKTRYNATSSAQRFGWTAHYWCSSEFRTEIWLTTSEDIANRQPWVQLTSPPSRL